MDISFAEKFSTALKGKYKSGSKLGSNGTDVKHRRSCLAQSFSRENSQEIRKPNMAACKEP
ncbi:hypothetical protein NC653_034128 [Populus alba x Populus x berolinensis]|uniref:Uncharacterized protein n=1 Tax=Populus alba x Populus x berolinensis TaxID=444605 RepID=A0AAD6PVU5_9ROSI|nr:hypothetical protein NC653_034128 [Populus alba x Populus x berolinensis]